MKRKQLKFVIGSVVILLTLAFLGFSGFQESMAYYQTVSELYASKDKFYDKRLKVAGDVVPGTIEREGNAVKFVISQELEGKLDTLPVLYVGTDPLPDTFRDRAQAVVEGTYGRDGVFTATGMQAKCASKYEKETAAGVTPDKTEYGTSWPVLAGARTSCDGVLGRRFTSRHSPQERQADCQRPECGSRRIHMHHDGHRIVNLLVHR
jgi:cytochrome c-type biogenesis protein CcmE